MAKIKIFLFGRFQVQIGEDALSGLEARKVQELLSFLLVHRASPHPRETLAGLFWGEMDTVHAKKNLRQTLWVLQQVLLQPASGNGGAPDQPLLQVEDDWVQVNPRADYWLDIADFEQDYTTAQGIDPRQLSEAQAGRLSHTAALYRGDLLEGLYQDWCLYERERLQNMYLNILEKLTLYADHHRFYEDGLAYAAKILRFDRTNEHIHNLIMRIYYAAGRRSEALRQFEVCAVALREELDVAPSKKTSTLYEQIRAEELHDQDEPLVLAYHEPQTSPLASRAVPDGPTLTAVLDQMRQFQASLTSAQNQLQNQIQQLENLLQDWMRR